MLVYIPTYFVPGGKWPVFFSAFSAQTFLMMLTATVIPSAILILCIHQIAKALRLQRGFEYAAVGSVTTLLCCLVFAPASPFTSVRLFLGLGLIYGALMGRLYRRFAGLEPIPLPEEVIVTDQAALVSEDHPSRHDHRVVFTD
jgi:hypothetical protein